MLFRAPVQSSAVLLVDLQDRLAQAMDAEAMARVAQKAANVAAGAKLLGVPVLVTEQYPKGLGSTLPVVAEAAEGATVIDKTNFSCCGVPPVQRWLAEHDDRVIVIGGMETHICLWQTVRDLRAGGREVVVLADAVISRSPADRQVGLDLCRQAGALISSSETVLMDWVGGAHHERFKDISRIIK